MAVRRESSQRRSDSAWVRGDDLTVAVYPVERFNDST